MKTIFGIMVALLVAAGVWYIVSQFVVINVSLPSMGTQQSGAQAAAPGSSASGASSATTGGQAGVANPASVNCVTTLGGTLEMKEETGGTAGYCHLPDGRVCEEWSLFRGGCTAPAAATPAPTAFSNVYAAGNLVLGTDGNAMVGTYLIGYNGMTLYSSANDTGGASACTGQCAAVWPPYIVPDKSALANTQSGVKGAVGYLKRADGSLQVTYDKQPLYFYANDHKSGDTTGEDVGGVWFVVKP